MQDQVNKFTSLKSCLLYGAGESKYSQCKQNTNSYILTFEFVDKKIKKLKPNVLVCTPGRLIDVIDTFGLDLSEVKYFVLDEGDRMLDMGFQEDIEYVQKCIDNKHCKSMIFSATLPNFILRTASKSMNNPVMLDLVGSDTSQLPSNLTTKAVICSSKRDKLAHIQKYIATNRDKKIIVFAETIKEC